MRRTAVAGERPWRPATPSGKTALPRHPALRPTPIDGRRHAAGPRPEASGPPRGPRPPSNRVGRDGRREARNSPWAGGQATAGTTKSRRGCARGASPSPGAPARRAAGITRAPYRHRQEVQPVGAGGRAIRRVERDESPVPPPRLRRRGRATGAASSPPDSRRYERARRLGSAPFRRSSRRAMPLGLPALIYWSPTRSDHPPATSTSPATAASAHPVG